LKDNLIFYHRFSSLSLFGGKIVDRNSLQMVFRPLAAATLILVAQPVIAQSELDRTLNSMNAQAASANNALANSALQEAIVLENSGKLVLAAGAYLDVMDLDGEGTQVPRSIAAVRLCGVRMKQGRYAEARRICAEVEHMPGASGNIQHTADEIIKMMDRAGMR
jgi:hypothetical protein